MRGWSSRAVFCVFLSAVAIILISTVFRGTERRIPQTAAGEPPLQTSKVPHSSVVDDDRKWGGAYGTLPLAFEENHGQAASVVTYLSHGPGYEIFFTHEETVLSLRRPEPHPLPLHDCDAPAVCAHKQPVEKTSVVRFHFEGASTKLRTAGVDRLPGKANYFIGNDPTNWHADIPTYARVLYAGLYPGVDLVFYGNRHRAEYDFVVAPGTNPKLIQFALEGANRVRINRSGDLVLSISGGELRLQKPVVYQQLKGIRREVEGGYLLSGNHRVAFAVGAYDRGKTLVIDPVLNYSTYLGGTGNESGLGIAVDSQGDAFVTGTTFSTDFPTTSGAFNKGPLASNANGTVFVTELNPAGTQELYSTYLAGTGGDSGSAIAVDSGGKVYVTGQTRSIDFPTTSSNALKPGPLAANPSGASFISKIDPTLSGTSSLVYSSYLGGTNGDSGAAIAVDAAGNAYVTGTTFSPPGSGAAMFPITAGAFQSTLSSAFGNAFLTRIDTTKSGNASLVYSTYLGGNGANAASPASVGFGDGGFGVAADSSSAAYLVGTTTSTNFPTTSTAFDTNSNPPAAAAIGTAFVSKIDTSGAKTGAASLLYSTYLGGEKSDFGLALSLGPNNVAYVTGTTSSLNFPTFPGAFQRTGDSSGSAFLSLIDTSLTGSPSLKYSTFLGGGGTTGFGIRADASGNAGIAGATASPSFPVTSGAFQMSLASGATGDAFISKLNPAGNGASDLVYSTYFGGKGATSQDTANAIAIDSSNNAYITGTTTAATFPVQPNPGAFQVSLKGPSDAFVAKLTLEPVVGLTPASLAFGGQFLNTASAAQTVTLTNNGNAALAINSIAASGDFSQTNTCGMSLATGASCTISVTFTPTALGPRAGTLTVTDSANGNPQTAPLTGTGWDFTLSAQSPLDVTDGSSGNSTVTVTPLGGFNQAVSLDCSGAPMLSTCTISPSSVTPADGVKPVTATLTVTTKASVPPQLPPSPVPPVLWLRFVPLFVALIMLILLRTARRLRMPLGIAAGMLIVITLAGCSHASTPRGTTNLTVTAKSGPRTLTTTVVLNVK